MTRRRYATALHEAAHACAALLVYRDGLDLVKISRSPGGSVSDTAWGQTTFACPTDGRWIVIKLIGWMAAEELVGFKPPIPWPPSAFDAAEVDLEGLGAAIAELGMTADEYELCVTFARRLLDNPEFVRRVRLVAAVLETCPELTGDDVRALVGIEEAVA